MDGGNLLMHSHFYNCYKRDQTTENASSTLKESYYLLSISFFCKINDLGSGARKAGRPQYYRGGVKDHQTGQLKQKKLHEN